MGRIVLSAEVGSPVSFRLLSRQSLRKKLICETISLQAAMTETLANSWFLTGPTAAGKTQVGLRLAERLGAEILSLDSMSIYRRMDIGTAKPTSAERANIPH